jgi:hypothetical protein
MTSPVVKPVVTTVEPTNAKTWAAVIGTVLTVAVPYVLQVATYLPAPWPAVVGGVIGVLTILGVYKVPNHDPANTSIVPNDQITTLPPGVGYTPVPDRPVPPTVAPRKYTNPYRS